MNDILVKDLFGQFSCVLSTVSIIHTVVGIGGIARV